MRGTRRFSSFEFLFRRFIPAYAGNTPETPPPATPTAVHPRVCGEHTTSLKNSPSSCGSSPRMRGTRKEMKDKSYNPRFIPAYAGNTTEFGVELSL